MKKIPSNFEEYIDYVYKFYIKKQTKTYNVFVDYYGENRVDLQNICSRQDFVQIAKSISVSEELENYIRNKNLSSINNLEEIDKLPIEQRKLVYKKLMEFSEMLRLLNRGIPSHILIHFPKVTVTNEFGNSLDITHLWCKVGIKPSGAFYDVKFRRSEYTYSQYISEYTHSHLPKNNNPDIWLDPCFGRGPIKRTISNLIFPSTDNIYYLWGLFCLELDNWTKIESIAGGPYITINRISSKPTKKLFIDIPYKKVHSLTKYQLDFLEYFLKKKVLKFGYVDNMFHIAYSPLEILLLMSEVFIEWYNSYIGEKPTINELWCREEILRVNYENGELFVLNTDSAINMMVKKKVANLVFKGKPVIFNIIQDSIQHNYNILNPKLMIEYIKRITQILNVRYAEINKNTPIKYF